MEKTHPNLEIELYQQHQEEITRRNYLFFVTIGMFVYPLWSLMDFMLGDRSFLFYLFIRLGFVIPMIILHYLLRTRRFNNINLQFFIMLTLAGLGQSITSHYAGGMRSDYYNGLILMSFIQFTVFPGNSRYGVMLDIAYFLLYFPLNYFGHDISHILAIKQTCLYINYALFKYICSRKAYNLIYGSLNRYSITKELDNNRDVSNLFGELCHLISNPLFISMATLQRNLKVDGRDEKEELVRKSLSSLVRIESVVKKMQEFYRSQEFELSKYKYHLNEENIESKKN